MKPKIRPELCLFCKNESFTVEAKLKKPPIRETDFGLKDYYREVHSCDGCGHYYAEHQYDVENLYSGSYLEAKYQDLEGLRQQGERVLALPKVESNNEARVNRLLQFTGKQGINSSDEAVKVLDIGSGLCVFLARLKQVTAWLCHAMDKDPRYEQHAREWLEIRAFQSTEDADPSDEKFAVITWNKVLEHIKDPVSQLARSLMFLQPEGVVYIEVPDGEIAANGGYESDEFAIDHYHVFTPASLSLMVWRAGGRIISLERLKEPSGKATLICFVGKNRYE